MKMGNRYFAKTLTVVVVMAFAGCVYDRANNRKIERTAHFRDANNILEESAKSSSMSESSNQTVRERALDALPAEVQNALSPDKPQDAVYIEDNKTSSSDKPQDVVSSEAQYVVPEEAQYALFAEAQDALSVVGVFVKYMMAGNAQDCASCIAAAKKALSRIYYMDEIRTDALADFCQKTEAAAREWRDAKAKFVRIWDLVKEGVLEQSENTITIKESGCFIICVAYDELYGDHYQGGIRLPEEDGIIDIYNNSFESILQQACRFMFVFGKDDESSIRKGIEEAFSQEKAWLENMKRQYQILSSVALPSSRSSLTDEDVKVLILEFLMLEDSAQKM